MLRIHLSQPQKLSEAEKKALGALFLQCDEPYFIRDSKYTIKQEDGNNIEISLSRDILRYHQSELKTDPEYAIVRYKALGKGGSGSVYQSSFLFKAAAHSLVIENIQHAIKFIVNNDAVTAHTEYRLAPSKNRLKPPVYIPQLSEYAVVMKYFKHPTLFDLLEKDRGQKPENRLSALDRINICIALAKELDKNVHQRGVIHRDLKPKNIIVHYHAEKKKWQLTIIDYGHSKANTQEEDDSNNDIAGTKYYSSPEHCRPAILFQHLIKSMSVEDYTEKLQHCGRHNHFNTNEKSDIYSMGCVFTEILACDRSNNIQADLDLMDERYFGKILFENMFIDVPDADLLPKKKIRLLLNDTTHFFHSKREQIESIIDRLQDIKRSLLLSKKLHRYVSVSTSATTRPHSQSAPNFFAATPTHMPQHLHVAKELMNLAHGVHNHQFHHNMEISCKKLKKIIRKHKSLIDCHLEAHAPSRPLDRKM